jgi:hypothetical protein
MVNSSRFPQDRNQNCHRVIEVPTAGSPVENHPKVLFRVGFQASGGVWPYWTPEITEFPPSNSENLYHVEHVMLRFFRTMHSGVSEKLFPSRKSL